MNLVKSTQEFVSTFMTEFSNPYLANAKETLEDAKVLKSKIKEDTQGARNVAHNMRRNGIARTTLAWFTGKGVEADSDLANDDSEFSSGNPELDEGGDASASSVEIDKGTQKQISVSYQIASKQADLSTAHVATIVDTLNSRNSELTSAIKEVSRKLDTINETLKKIGGVTTAIAESVEKSENDKTTLFNDRGNLSLASIYSNAKEGLLANPYIGTASQFVEFGRQVFADDSPLSKKLAKLTNTILGLTGAYEKQLSILGGKSINQIGSGFNDMVSAVTQSVLRGLVNNKAFRFAFGDSFGEIESSRDYGKIAVDNRYNKNKATFDGMTRHTIVNIIPEYLKSINRALTGKTLNIDDKGNLTSRDISKEFNKVGLSGYTNINTGDALDRITKPANAAYRQSRGVDINEDLLGKAMEACSTVYAWFRYETGKMLSVNDLKDGSWHRRAYELMSAMYGTPISDAAFYVEVCMGSIVNDMTARYKFMNACEQAQAEADRSATEYRTSGKNSAKYANKAFSYSELKDYAVANANNRVRETYYPEEAESAPIGGRTTIVTGQRSGRTDSYINSVKSILDILDHGIVSVRIVDGAPTITSGYGMADAPIPTGVLPTVATPVPSTMPTLDEIGTPRSGGYNATQPATQSTTTTSQVQSARTGLRNLVDAARVETIGNPEIVNAINQTLAPVMGIGQNLAIAKAKYNIEQNIKGMGNLKEASASDIQHAQSAYQIVTASLSDSTATAGEASAAYSEIEEIKDQKLKSQTKKAVDKLLTAKSDDSKDIKNTGLWKILSFGWGIVKKTVSPIIKFAKNILFKGFDILKNLGNKLFTKAKGLLFGEKQGKGLVGHLVSGIGNVIKGYFKVAFAIGKQGVSNIGSGAKQLLGAWFGHDEETDSAGNVIRAGTKGLARQMLTPLTAAVKGGAWLGSKAIGGIKTLASNVNTDTGSVIGSIVNKGKSAYGTAKKLVSRGANFVVESANGLREDISDGISSVKDRVTDSLEKTALGRGVMKVAGNIKSGLVGTGEGSSLLGGIYNNIFGENSLLGKIGKYKAEKNEKAKKKQEQEAEVTMETASDSFAKKIFNLLTAKFGGGNDEATVEGEAHSVTPDEEDSGQTFEPTLADIDEGSKRTATASSVPTADDASVDAGSGGTSGTKGGGKKGNLGILNNILDSIGGIGKIMMGVGEVVMSVVMSMSGIQTIVDMVKSILTDGLAPLNKVFKSVATMIKPICDIMTGGIQQLIDPIIGICDNILNVMSPILEGLTPLLNSILEPIVGIVGQLGDLFTVFLAPIMGSLNAVLIPAVTVIGDLVSATAGILQMIVGSISYGVGLVGSMFSPLLKVFGAGSVAESMKGLKETGASQVKTGWTTMIDGFVSAAKDTVGGVKNFGTNFMDGVSAMTAADVEPDIPDNTSSDVVYRGSVMDGLTGNGDFKSQASYGNKLGMRDHGCGPIALADAYNRRTGANISGDMMAAAMLTGHGDYSPYNGASVYGMMHAGQALGMDMVPGGVTYDSLNHATPNNPITVLGSGYAFGTHPGNNHYMNVIGGDGRGISYVSNPLTGKIEARSTSSIAGSSVLGLYGHGDSEDAPTMVDVFGDKVTDLIESLKNLGKNFFEMFTKSKNESSAKSIAEASEQEQTLKNMEEKFPEEYAQAYELAKQEFDSKYSSSGYGDKKLNELWKSEKYGLIRTHFEKILNDSGKLTYDKMTSLDDAFSETEAGMQALSERESSMGTLTEQLGAAGIGGTSSSLSAGYGGGVKKLIGTAAKVFAATPENTEYGHGSISFDLDGRRRTLRPDCSGYVDFIVNEMGYKFKAGNDVLAAAFVNAKDTDSFITKADGSSAAKDWEIIKHPTELKEGDIVARDGSEPTGGANGWGGAHVGIAISNLDEPFFTKGFDAGGTKNIYDTHRASVAYLNGDPDWKSLLHSTMGRSAISSVFRYIKPELEAGNGYLVLQRYANSPFMTNSGTATTEAGLLKYYDETMKAGFTPEEAAGLIGPLSKETRVLSDPNYDLAKRYMDHDANGNAVGDAYGLIGFRDKYFNPDEVGNTYSSQMKFLYNAYIDKNSPNGLHGIGSNNLVRNLGYIPNGKDDPTPNREKFRNVTGYDIALNAGEKYGPYMNTDFIEGAAHHEFSGVVSALTSSKLAQELKTSVNYYKWMMDKGYIHPDTESTGLTSGYNAEDSVSVEGLEKPEALLTAISSGAKIPIAAAISSYPEFSKDKPDEFKAFLRTSVNTGRAKLVKNGYYTNQTAELEFIDGFSLPLRGWSYSDSTLDGWLNGVSSTTISNLIDESNIHSAAYNQRIQAEDARKSKYFYWPLNHYSKWGDPQPYDYDYNESLTRGVRLKHPQSFWKKYADANGIGSYSYDEMNSIYSNAYGPMFIDSTKYNDYVENGITDIGKLAGLTFGKSNYMAYDSDPETLYSVTTKNGKTKKSKISGTDNFIWKMIMANGDSRFSVPPVDTNKIQQALSDQYSQFNTTSSNEPTILQVTDKEANKLMTKVLNHTFEVKSSSIESKLIQILEKMDRMSSSKVTVPSRSSAPIFDDGIPAKVQQLSIG